MIWFICAALGVAILVYAVFPPFREAVDGWKSRLTGIAALGMGILETVDRQVLTQALGLDTQGKAYLFLGMALAMWAFREVAKKPGALVKK
jgi:hypothetical protein